ncbi:MAG: hypothetical protein QME62_07050 [Armatimonadota bacterium]|nr:hypothetical protein [Armatimonadota bacterium]
MGKKAKDKQTKVSKEAKEAREQKAEEVYCIPWWRDWRQVLLGIIVLVWAVSLVSVTIYDATHPPTQEELLQR